MRLRTAAAIWASFGALIATSAPAQIGLPALRLPQLPQLPPTMAVNAAPGAAFEGVRRAAAQRLIQSNRERLEADPNGAAILRGQIVGLDISAAALEQALAAGFVLLRRQPLPGVDAEIFVLRVPSGMLTRRALLRLRALDPQASFDYDHVYAQSAESPASPVPQQPAVAAAATVTPAPAAPGTVRVGLIDGGVQRTHAVFHSVAATLWGCDGRSMPSVHGTEVASLLVGDAAPFHGAAPGAALYAADVYCGEATGGAIETVAAAFGWLGAQRVAVINVSLVGPDNLVLKLMVRQMIARGFVIVAAVGNDGPAAPPLYPAAYPGVIGVTAVDAQLHLLLEAGRGPQVSFAAPGADMAAATVPEGYETVRGTSFAAPIVAGLLAMRLAEPDREAAQRAVASLAHEAAQRDTRRDGGFGLGLVGADLQTAPALVGAGPARAGP
jgi:hypothetical protein